MSVQAGRLSWPSMHREEKGRRLVSIDIHNHAIPKRVLELVSSDRRYGVSIKDGIWRSQNIAPFELHDAWHDPDAKLREMDRIELDQAVLSAAPKALYFYELPIELQTRVARVTNAGFKEYCAQHPDRLHWMAHVPLAFPEESARVLEAAVSDGAVGVQVGTSAAGRRLDDQIYDPFWSAVERHRVPVFIHPAYELITDELTVYRLETVIGLPFETTIALERLICSGFLDRYPSIKIVAAHGGGYFPWGVGRLQSLGIIPSVAGKPVSPWSYVGQIKFDSKVDDLDTLRFLIGRAGADNVMIGTDCSFSRPPISPVQDVKEVLRADDSSDVRKVLVDNATKLFGLPVRAAPAGTLQSRPVVHDED
jgi:aminocarboxymuconate-semialdehyde decarboxylase